MEIEIKEITRDNFQTEVIEAGGPVLLDFYADWCGPCKRQLPVLLEAAKEACDVKFCKVNIDHNQELCEKFDVEQVPTMLVMNGERVYRRIVGSRSLEELLECLEM
ncbi:MAG: thioredoxin family protein [Lachnospiraceae bacterium]|nr:thioredoxin [Lachnospiraceae bacterium]MDE7059556.1 thioredoxin family protein [Lachnospiraceae bacterium]